MSSLETVLLRISFLTANTGNLNLAEAAGGFRLSPGSIPLLAINLKEVGPDVFFLQETSCNDKLSGHLESCYILDGQGSMITGVSRGIFKSLKFLSEGSGYRCWKTVTHTDQSLILINVHAISPLKDRGFVQRHKQIGEVLETIEDIYAERNSFIAAGDFNFDPYCFGKTREMIAGYLRKIRLKRDPDNDRMVDMVMKWQDFFEENRFRFSTVNDSSVATWDPTIADLFTDNPISGIASNISAMYGMKIREYENTPYVRYIIPTASAASAIAVSAIARYAPVVKLASLIRTSLEKLSVAFSRFSSTGASALIIGTSAKSLGYLQSKLSYTLDHVITNLSPEEWEVLDQPGNRLDRPSPAVADCKPFFMDHSAVTCRLIL